MSLHYSICASCTHAQNVCKLLLYIRAAYMLHMSVLQMYAVYNMLSMCAAYVQTAFQHRCAAHNNCTAKYAIIYSPCPQAIAAACKYFVCSKKGASLRTDVLKPKIYIHTYIHTYIHIYTHTYKHTYICMHIMYALELATTLRGEGLPQACPNYA